MEKHLKLPPNQTIAAIYLGVLAILAVGLKLDFSFAMSRALAFAALAVGFLAWPVLTYKSAAFKHPFFTNNLITILILFLLLDDQLGWLPMLGIGLFTSGIKQMVRFNKQPLFNPAAAGLAVASALGILISWWGTSFAPRFSGLDISIAAFLTLPFGIYLIYKYRKWQITLSFAVVFGLLAAIWLKTIPLNLLFEGTVMFFALIMIVEPKTSPNLVTQQIVFGACIGAMSVLGLVFGVSSAYIYSLLIANLVYKLYANWQLKKHMAAAIALRSKTQSQ